MPKSVLFELKLQILALAVFFLSLLNCWGQILPNLTFESQKPHISGQSPGKIEVPLCQNLYSTVTDFKFWLQLCFLEPRKNGGLRFYLF